MSDRGVLTGKAVPVALASGTEVVTTIKGSKGQEGAEVTPSDSTDLAGGVTAAIYVGGAGDLRVTLTGMANGTHVTFAALGAGFQPLAAKRVWSTGTTA